MSTVTKYARTFRVPLTTSEEGGALSDYQTPRKSQTATPHHSTGPSITTPRNVLPTVAHFTERYNVCNSLESKLSSGYLPIVNRGEVFSGFTDMRSTCITSTLLPPAVTTIVDSEERVELVCRWVMSSSIETDIVKERTSTGGLEESCSSAVATGSTSASPKLSAKPPPSVPSPEISKVRSVEFLIDALGVLAVTPSSSAASSTSGTSTPQATAKVSSSQRAMLSSTQACALMAVTTYQHTSVFWVPISDRSSTAREASSPELIQTWTAPTTGKRTTSSLITLVGVPIGFRAPTPSCQQATSPSTHLRGTCLCEAILVLGMERGELLFCSVAEERVLQRANTGSSTTLAVVPYPVSCIAEVQNGAQSALRSILLSSRDGNLPLTSTRGHPKPPTAGQRSSLDAVEESSGVTVLAIGFDNGSVLMCHVSAGANFTAHCVRHVSFGTRPVYCIESSVPGFFTSLWAAHCPKGPQSASRSTSLTAEVLPGADGNTTTPPRGSTRGDDIVGVTGMRTVLAAHFILCGTDADWEEDAPQSNPASPARNHLQGNATNNASIGPTPIRSPAYAAIAAEGGMIYIVQLPSLEKRTSVSTRCEEVGSCGEVFTVKWITRPPSHGTASKGQIHLLQPELLVAGGEGDDIAVFVVGNLQQGQFRRANAPPTAWEAHDAAHKLGESTASHHKPHGQPTSVSLRLSQRLTFHRSWIQRLCVVPVVSVISPSNSSGTVSPYDSAALQPTSHDAPNRSAVLLGAVSLDDTVTFWNVQVPVGALPLVGRINHATHDDSPMIQDPRRPPPLRAVSPPQANNDFLTISVEPAHVLPHLHEDMVAQVASLSAGMFGTLWVTVCLRGRVKVWSAYGDDVHQ